ncbi:MAG TPA: long-chain fatty acid--CoA ligase [Terriglobia bacterium]|nr:long-chain fatty acid--CoA ligase [Terriglobia bacterium]
MAATDFATLNELFVAAVEKHAKPDAFLSKREGIYRGLSSAQALRHAAALALALEGFGVRSGDRVALLSENREEWALADYAVMGLGAVDVPLYPTLPPSDIEYILRDSESRGIILSSAAQLQKIVGIAERLPDLKFIVMMDSAPADHPAVYFFEKTVEEQLRRTPSPESDFRARALQAKPGDTATIIYTSGTTGQPKGVVLTHANIVSNIRACESLFDFNPADRLLSFLPLSHIFERMVEYFAFGHGATLAYAESLDTLSRNMLEARPTIMAVVPRVLEKAHGKILDAVRQGPPARQKLFRWALGVGKEYALSRIEKRPVSPALRLKHGVADALVASKIRARFGGKIKYLISGSAPLAKELAEFFHAVGLPVYEGYGLTETSPVIAVNFPGSVKLGTVGPVVAGLELKLGEESVDEQGRAGREILVRGPSVFAGYYKLEEETRQAFSDGWFHTGDLGTLSDDSFLTITGRKKNLMKTSGGKYISPEKIESLFQGHPYVAQMMVLGDARHFVAALIVPDFGRLEDYARQKAITFQSREELAACREIHEFMQQQVEEVCAHLAQYERIRQIALLPREFSVDSGELSPTQKVRRFVVEERCRKLIEEIYRRPAPQRAVAG